MFMLRFDMRAPEGGAPIADLYQAAIDMAEWGESNGCLTALISEHHTSPDGYLPSPLVLATAIAARTTTLPIVVGALLLNFYDPVKVAEDMIVLDIVSRGRVSYVIGLGYRPEEYDMFGVEMATRGATIDRNLEVLRRALAGERFEHAGRTVHVTPAPYSPAGPRLAYGGHSLAAARRAGRLGLDLFAEGGTQALVDAYKEAAAAAGVRPGTTAIPDGSSGTSVFVADDIDRAWREMGPYLLHDAVTYREWMGDNHAASSRSEATDVAELRAEHGAYRILTVDEATKIMGAGVPLALHPLCGGMPPELAWPSVRLAGEAARAAGSQAMAP
jgi:alkanesulfonate monooxygenase SsuD/methylene tetrahydromethanopterin reductase-like flavin-dependent oxidoreductase (luciferase family)